MYYDFMEGEYKKSIINELITDMYTSSHKFVLGTHESNSQIYW